MGCSAPAFKAVLPHACCCLTSGCARRPRPASDSCALRIPDPAGSVAHVSKENAAALVCHLESLHEKAATGKVEPAIEAELRTLHTNWAHAAAVQAKADQAGRETACTQSAGGPKYTRMLCAALLCSHGWHHPPRVGLLLTRRSLSCNCLSLTGVRRGPRSLHAWVVWLSAVGCTSAQGCHKSSKGARGQFNHWRQAR